eukprot:jgi/Ulvmu1/11644/UM008_0048.1
MAAARVSAILQEEPLLANLTTEYQRLKASGSSVDYRAWIREKLAAASEQPSNEGCRESQTLDSVKDCTQGKSPPRNTARCSPSWSLDGFPDKTYDGCFPVHGEGLVPTDSPSSVQHRDICNSAPAPRAPAIDTEAAQPEADREGLPAAPRSPTTAQLIEQSTQLHATMRQQAAQLREQQAKLSALSQRVLQHRASPARASPAPTDEPSPSPPVPGPPVPAAPPLQAPQSPAAVEERPVPQGVPHDADTAPHFGSHAAARPHSSASVASFAVHRSSRSLAGSLAGAPADVAAGAQGARSAHHTIGDKPGLTDATSMPSRGRSGSGCGSPAASKHGAAASAERCSGLSPDAAAPFHVSAASTRHERAVWESAPWARTLNTAPVARSENGLNARGPLLSDVAGACQSVHTAGRAPNCGTDDRAAAPGTAAHEPSHGGKADVPGAVQELLAAVAETRRRRTAFEHTHVLSPDAHVGGLRSVPATEGAPRSSCDDARPAGAARQYRGVSGPRSRADDAAAGAAVPPGCSGDGGLAAVQHPVVKSVLSQLVSSIASSTAAAVKQADGMGDGAGGRGDWEASAGARASRRPVEGSVRGGDWQERHDVAAERPQPPPARGAPGMPRTANGWRGFLSVKDLRPQSGRGGGQDARGGRGGDAGRGGTGVERRRPAWNADVMPAASAAGRGKRGVAPIGRGEEDSVGNRGPGALRGAGRGRPGLPVSLGKRDRDGIQRGGRRDAGAAGRRRAAPAAKMDAATWRAMTEGADDPLLEGEETGLSLGVPAEEEEDCGETESMREYEHRRVAVAALEVELAEAARREAALVAEGLSETSSLAPAPPQRAAVESPPPEAWQRLAELEARVSILGRRLDASEAAHSRQTSHQTSRAPSRATAAASPPPPPSRHGAPRPPAPAARAVSPLQRGGPADSDAGAPDAVPELAERLARIELAERQIYAKWFTASGEPRDDCSSGSSASPGTSDSSTPSHDGCDPAGVVGLSPASHHHGKARSAAVGPREEGAGARCGGQMRGDARASPGGHFDHMHAAAAACRWGHTAPCSGGIAESAVPDSPHTVAEGQGAVSDGLAGDAELQPSPSINPGPYASLTDSGKQSHSSGDGGSSGTGAGVGSGTKCPRIPVSAPGPDVFTQEDVQRLLQGRQRAHQVRALRNASIAAAGGIGSAATVASAVLTGAPGGLPVGHGGPQGRGAQPGDVDIVQMVEAAADRVIHEVVGDTVNEMFLVADNAVDWLLASEFAPPHGEK